MGINLDLCAQPDPTWSSVEVTVRPILLQALRQLAELAAENPERLASSFEALASALDRPTEGWDEAVADFEADTGLDEASTRISEAEARQLAAELTAAADKTFSARLRAAGPFPEQRGQGRAA